MDLHMRVTFTKSVYTHKNTCHLLKDLDSLIAFWAPGRATRRLGCKEEVELLPAAQVGMCHFLRFWVMPSKKRSLFNPLNLFLLPVTLHRHHRDSPRDPHSGGRRSLGGCSRARRVRTIDRPARCRVRR